MMAAVPAIEHTPSVSDSAQHYQAAGHRCSISSNAAAAAIVP